MISMASYIDALYSYIYSYISFLNVKISETIVSELDMSQISLAWYPLKIGSYPDMRHQLGSKIVTAIKSKEISLTNRSDSN